MHMLICVAFLWSEKLSETKANVSEIICGQAKKKRRKRDGVGWNKKRLTSGEENNVLKSY